MRRWKVITVLTAFVGALSLGVGVAVVYLVTPSDNCPGSFDQLAQEAGSFVARTDGEPNGDLDGQRTDGEPNGDLDGQRTDPSPTSEEQGPVSSGDENTVGGSTFSPFSSKENVNVDFSEFRQLLRRDAIRPIYEPKFSPGKLTSLSIGDLVIGVEINGDSRAYPIGPLTNRETVNDVVGGVPILVTW